MNRGVVKKNYLGTRNPLVIYKLIIMYNKKP